MNTQQDIFAVFVVAPFDGKLAATTRPTSPGKIGLPGGKVDPGETLAKAVLREAKEEGFAIRGLNSLPFHIQEVDGKLVAWFAAESANKLSAYKEMGRVLPIAATKEELMASGYGNEVALQKF